MNGYIKFYNNHNSEPVLNGFIVKQTEKTIILRSRGIDFEYPRFMFYDNFTARGRVFAIIGFSGAGKDLTEDLLIEHYNFNRIKSFTSRPKRDGEIEGETYYFLTRQEYLDLAFEKGFNIERSYNVINENNEADIWYYGYSTKDLELGKKNYIAIVDYDGYDKLKKELGDIVIPIYLEVSEETRRQRALKRSNFNELEWMRRAKDDRENVLKKIEKNIPVQNVIKAESMTPFEVVEYIMKYFVLR